MSDSYRDPQQQEKRFENSRENTRGGYRSGKGSGNREFGGFRIRLSDNEMRSARALQEAFNLRSTVAVLGFALRTLGQMLEEGKIDELIAQHQSQPTSNRGRKEESGNSNGRRDRYNNNSDNSSSARTKPNPFARPEKPSSISSSDDQVNEENSKENIESIEETIEQTSNASNEQENGEKESSSIES